MKLYDKVSYNSHSKDKLHCATFYYPYAFVVSLDPLILISESGDMKWSCLSNPENLIVLESIDSLPLGVIERCIKEGIGNYILPEIKQVIIVRSDLKNTKGNKIRTGKLIAQSCHASVNSYNEVLKLDEAVLNQWKKSGTKKICLSVNSLEELLDLNEKLKLTSIPMHLVTDNGLTEFSEPTITCLGIGPWYSTDIDLFTKHLSLF